MDGRSHRAPRQSLVWAIDIAVATRPSGAAPRGSSDLPSRRVGRPGPIAAAASARAFTQHAWPSTRTSSSGWSGARRGERCLRGEARDGPADLSPPPTPRASSWRAPAARARPRARRTPPRSRCRRRRPRAAISPAPGRRPPPRARRRPVRSHRVAGDAHQREPVLVLDAASRWTSSVRVTAVTRAARPRASSAAPGG